MQDSDLQNHRRSTRLAISIPVIISGKDADGKSFNECVHTLVVNKHGGKVATIHPLALGSEVLIENPTLNVQAKAAVVWMSEKRYPGDLHHAGLQLLAAQDIWGVAFPPDDWHSDPQEESLPGPAAQPAPAKSDGVKAPAPVPAPPAEEAPAPALPETPESALPPESADQRLQDFQARLEELAQGLAAKLEADLGDQVAVITAAGMSGLKQEIEGLKVTLGGTREELTKLGAAVQELRHKLDTGRESPSPTPLDVAKRQLAALANSAVEQMNRAAESGLSQYRAVLQKEAREAVARLRADTAPKPAPPGKPAPRP